MSAETAFYFECKMIISLFTRNPFFYLRQWPVTIQIQFLPKIIVKAIRLMFHQFLMAVESAPGHSYPFGFCDVCADWNLSGIDRRTHGKRNVLYEYGLPCAISCCINPQIFYRNDRIGTASLQYDSVCESIKPFC